MNKNNLTALLAQNSEHSDGLIKSLLEQRNIEVWECADGIEAIRKSFANNPDLIFLDIALPRLNGYHCARLLKSDPVTNFTPVIHMGFSKNPIDQYWSRICGGDCFLERPINQKDLSEALQRLIKNRKGKSRLFVPFSSIPDLEDYSILNLTTNLMEKELLRSTILREINLIDVCSMPSKDLVMSLMMIINSIFDLDIGVALLLYEQNAELLFYQNGRTEQNRLDEIKKLIFKHLQKHGIYLNPAQIRQTILQSPQPRQHKGETNDIYIHSKESGPINSVLAFENIGFEELNKNEKEILQLTLELANGVIEKKVYFHTSQEFSIIDVNTDFYSMAFFMEVLGREIENAKRNGYPMVLFTVGISNFNDITKDKSLKEVYGLVQFVKKIILKHSRKSDIVSSFETGYFAFLLTHTRLQKARLAQQRTSNYLTKNLSAHLPSGTEIVLDMNICEFNPDKDLTPEIFFSHVQSNEKAEENQAG